MRYNLIFKIVLLLQILTLKNGYSQENSKLSSPASFFLDCEDCDFTFVRQELPFVSFVRDPQLADVHILVTDSNTGSGGNKYFLNFIGLKEFKGLSYDYTMTSKQSDTDNDVRKTLLKLIKIGILPYYSKTDFLDQLNIDLEESNNKRADEMVTDAWNKWVFNIESEVELQKEKSQNQYSVNINANAGKVTEEWKTKFEVSYELNQENYFDNGEKITNKQDAKELSTDFIKNLTDKWSAGFFGHYLSSAYLNTKNYYRVSSGIEYNFFPWEECNRRAFIIRYGAGINYINYMEETIYDKLKETLFSEALLLRLKLVQPWGDISVGLEGSHYFHDFSKNRLTLESDFSIRLSKNLSVFCEIQSEVIHDQFYLPKGDASLEDILLKRRKLETTYELSSQIGFRFTFGSIFNNVVNERF
ncbi:MAG TPA: hypothetical protein VMV77_21275 [Bacteroidales bacterium]|nr:hypothetical protein [Bacteroidales bacterium]